MKKPVIGVTVSQETPHSPLSLNTAYAEALGAAGGIPVLLPFPLPEEDLDRLLSCLDGILFTGGGDIYPLLLGEETHRNCGPVSLERDLAEFFLARQARQRNLPALGICRGAQVINAALGGSIWQDIPSQCRPLSDGISAPAASAEDRLAHAGAACPPYPMAHSQPFAPSLCCHTVTVTADSLLGKLVRSRAAEAQQPKKSEAADTFPISVNSLHHQAVRHPAPGLEVCAMAPDGITEAVWAPDAAFFLGVQWHPERLWREHPEQLAIFQGFIESCV